MQISWHQIWTHNEPNSGFSNIFSLGKHLELDLLNPWCSAALLGAPDHASTIKAWTHVAVVAGTLTVTRLTFNKHRSRVGTVRGARTGNNSTKTTYLQRAEFSIAISFQLTRVYTPQQINILKLKKIRWFQRDPKPPILGGQNGDIVSDEDGILVGGTMSYPLVNKHSNGKSPSWIGNTSSNGGFFIAMLDYRSVLPELVAYCVSTVYVVRSRTKE